jgi:hypothetical protein
MEAPDRFQLQERFEQSRGGRLLISAFIVVTLACVLVSNLPAGRAQQRAYDIAQPYLLASGLDQSWRIFAPNPRSEVLYLEARVVRADGSVSIWRTPTSGPLIGGYRDSHWRKFVEHAVLRDNGTPDGGWPALWRTIALYVARQEGGHDGARPVQVTLIRRWAQEIPPGKGPPYLTPFQNTPYYTLTLGVQPHGPRR